MYFCPLNMNMKLKNGWFSWRKPWKIHKNYYFSCLSWEILRILKNILNKSCRSYWNTHFCPCSVHVLSIFLLRVIVFEKISDMFPCRHFPRETRYHIGLQLSTHIFFLRNEMLHGFATFHTKRVPPHPTPCFGPKRSL